MGHDRDRLADRLDRVVELAAATASIRETIELLAYVEEHERVEAFADALRRDLILPEDF